MTDLRDLYQQVILDHSRQPRNHYELAEPTHFAQGFNRLCGDKLTLYLQIIAERIEKISFIGSGCAIAMASASLMTEHLLGKSVKEALVFFHIFHDLLLLSDEQNDPLKEEQLNKLKIFKGVREFPARVKCATLAWHTLQAALTSKLAVNQSISTE